MNGSESSLTGLMPRYKPSSGWLPNPNQPCLSPKVDLGNHAEHPETHYHAPFMDCIVPKVNILHTQISRE